MSVPPNTGPQDPFGSPSQSPSGQGQYGQQPSYPQQPPAYGQPAYGQQPPSHQQPGQFSQPGYPQQQPGYGQMPPPPAGSFGASPQTRPGQVTGAAVLGFIIGGLGLIVYLLAFTVTSSIGLGLTGFVTFLSIVGIVLSAVYIWGALQALGGKDARILLGAAGIGILLNLISMIVSFSAIQLISFILPGVIIFLLLSKEAKAWFDVKGAKHF